MTSKLQHSQLSSRQLCQSETVSGLILTRSQNNPNWAPVQFLLQLLVAMRTWTVFLIRWEGPGNSGEYKSVKNRELIKVDLPNPDSPGKNK